MTWHRRQRVKERQQTRQQPASWGSRRNLNLWFNRVNCWKLFDWKHCLMEFMPCGTHYTFPALKPVRQTGCSYNSCNNIYISWLMNPGESLCAEDSVDGLIFEERGKGLKCLSSRPCAYTSRCWVHAKVSTAPKGRKRKKIHHMILFFSSFFCCSPSALICGLE